MTVAKAAAAASVMSVALVATGPSAIAWQAQQANFSAADGYERFMGRWSRALAPLLVRFAGVRDGESLLDVGSGTGALTVARAAAAPSSRIVGIDPAAPYVEFARQQHARDRVTFEIGDARSLRFGDGEFDRTLSLLVVNFIPDAATAIDEMKRVTTRGGVVAAAVWDYAERMEMVRTFWDEAVALTPAHASKDQKHMPFAHRGELEAMWRARGFVDVVEEGLTIDTPFASFSDYWEPFLDKQGSTGAYVAALPDDLRRELRERIRRRVLGDGPDRPFTLQARAWAVRGRVP